MEQKKTKKDNENVANIVELYDRVAKRTGYVKKPVKEIIKATFLEMSIMLAEERREIQIRGFGKLRIHQLKRTKFRDMNTKDGFKDLSDRKICTIKFKIGRSLRNRLNRPETTREKNPKVAAIYEELEKRNDNFPKTFEELMTREFIEENENKSE